MSYISIQNLYRYPDIMLFREVYAMEKIHGSSSHVSWKPEERKLNIHGGGGSQKDICGFLKPDVLKERFAAEFPISNVTIYGEAYGGRMMRMHGTYGQTIRFIAFDVTVNGLWLAVPAAEDVARKVGLDFVHYDKIENTIEKLNALMNAPSVQAVRNGITEERPREGIVIRPLMELRKNNDERIICKHRRPEFRETKADRELREVEDVDPAKFAILEKAQEIAEEWVVDLRFVKVMEKLQIDEPTIKDSRRIIDAMLEDVKRESTGEVVWTREAEVYVGRATAALFKEYLRVSPEDVARAKLPPLSPEAQAARTPRPPP